MAWPARIPARHIRVARAAGHIADPVSRLRFLRAAAPPPHSFRRRARRNLWILGALLLPASLVPMLITRPPAKPEIVRAIAQRPAAPSQTAQPVTVWQIEQTNDSELYSNGLRISTRYSIAGPPRAYRAFPRQAAAGSATQLRSTPAGIVFHTSESCQAPFQAQETPVIKRLGEQLLEFVRRNRSYHYVIDRFGRVFRVVAESDVAYHAGHSVWADKNWFYLDLNRSFLGVSFETQTPADGGAPIASPAQLRAAAMLIEMLRSRYPIPAENCVTHAQVSVNPANMLIGYHTDWAGGFPFAAVGLPDNYRQALPSVYAFGFGYEPVWLKTASPMAPGIEQAELEVLRGAAAAGMRPAVYRQLLQHRYRDRDRAQPVTPAAPPPGDIRSPPSPVEPSPPPPAAHKKTRRHAPAEK
jgi:hypothetical protein